MNPPLYCRWGVFVGVKFYEPSPLSFGNFIAPSVWRTSGERCPRDWVWNAHVSLKLPSLLLGEVLLKKNFFKKPYQKDYNNISVNSHILQKFYTAIETKGGHIFLATKLKALIFFSLSSHQKLKIQLWASSKKWAFKTIHSLSWCQKILPPPSQLREHLPIII